MTFQQTFNGTVHGGVAGRDLTNVALTIHVQHASSGPVAAIYGLLHSSARPSVDHLLQNGFSARDLLHAIRLGSLVWSGGQLQRRDAAFCLWAFVFMVGALAVPFLSTLLGGLWAHASASDRWVLLGFWLACICAMLWAVYLFVWPQVVAARVEAALGTRTPGAR